MDSTALRLMQEDELKARHRVVTVAGTSGTALPLEHPSCRAIATHPIAIGGKRDCRCLLRRDRLVVVAVWGGGIVVLDLEDPMQPRTIGKLELPASITSLALAGNILYASDWDNGLLVIDLADPSRPALVASHPALTHTQNRRVLVSGNILVLVNDHAFSVFDVTTPAQPKPLALHHRMRTGVGWFRGAALVSSTLFLTQGSVGLWTFDLADPTRPRPVCGLEIRLDSRPNERLIAEPIALFEGRAFVGTSSGIWCARLAPGGPESELFFTGPGYIRDTARGEAREGRLHFCAFEPHDHVHHIFDFANGVRYLGRQRLSRAAQLSDFTFSPATTLAAAGTDGLLVASF